MEKFDFAFVSAYGGEVAIACTDPTELERLVAGVKQMFPKLEVKHTSALPTADKARDFPTYFYGLKNLASREADVAWWVIRALCHSGWEPLGAASFVFAETMTRFYYQFRRKESG